MRIHQVTILGSLLCLHGLWGQGPFAQTSIRHDPQPTGRNTSVRDVRSTINTPQLSGSSVAKVLSGIDQAGFVPSRTGNDLGDAAPRPANDAKAGPAAVSNVKALAGWGAQTDVFTGSFDQRAPHIACDSTNNLYVAFENNDDSHPYTYISICRSSDGGASWSNWWSYYSPGVPMHTPTAVYANGNIFISCLYNNVLLVTRVAVDRSTYAFLYPPTPVISPPNEVVVGVRLCSDGEIFASPNAFVYLAYPFSQASGPNQVYFTRSTDNGATWSSQIGLGRVSSAYGAPEVGIGWAISGLYVAYVGTGVDSNNVMLCKSLDYGASFGTSAAVDTVGGRAKRGPSLTASGGNILMVFQEHYAAMDDDVVGVYSMDGGASWRRNPIATIAFVNEWNPWVSHDRFGNFYVTYMRGGYVYAERGISSPIVHDSVIVSGAPDASPSDFTTVVGLTGASSLSGACAAWVAGTSGDYNIYGNYYVSDITPPPAPTNLVATPSSWTNADISIDWTNPADPSGIAAAWYRLANPPTTNSDGTRTTDKPFTVNPAADGAQLIYVWLEDGDGNRDQNNRATTLLRHDRKPPANPTTITSSTHSINSWSTSRNILVSWSGAVDTGGSGIGGYSWVWTTSPSSLPDETVDGPGSSAGSPSLADGANWYFHVRTRDGAGNWSVGASHYGPFLIDSSSPGLPTISSPSPSIGSWVSNRKVDMAWTIPSDGNGSGVNGYSWLFDRSASTVPDQIVDGTATTTTSDPLPDGIGYFFHIRAVDLAGNWSSTTHYGSFHIDGTAPTGGTISINNGADTTGSLVVTLNGLGAFETGGSGLSNMRFSNNDATWSPWEVYSPTRANWDLSMYGGSTGEGQKTVCVQYGDFAGNQSSTVKDSIYYHSGDVAPPAAPLSLSATPNAWTNVNSFSVDWTNPSDLSGIAAAWYKSGNVPTSPFDGLRTTAKPLQVSADSSGGELIYVWLEDGAGNKDHKNRSSTTLLYDGIAPANGTISINGGGDTTWSLAVSLNSLGAVDGGGSGLSQMRFSNNNTIWSSWESFANTKTNWDLSISGGSSVQGLKTVYVQYSDVAGNVSTSYQDAIYYSVAKPAPTLLSPANNSLNQATTLTLSWSAPPGAVTCRLQVAIDSLFKVLVYDDSTIIGTTSLIGPLTNNQEYYWRMCAIYAGSRSGWSPDWSFTTQSRTAVSTSVAFPSDPASSTSYRLLSLPGLDPTPLGQLVSGAQKVDWRAFSDNGSPSDYLKELAGDSALTMGEGYWFLKKGDLGVSRSVALPLLDADGSRSISLHSGPNIIGNPFSRNIAWSAVYAANGLDASDLTLWSYTGQYVSSSVLEPFKGYYFKNNSNRSSLKIPFTVASGALQKPPAVEWKLRLVLETEINSDPENYLGIAPSAQVGLDEMDVWKPPLFLDQGFLYFRRPDWDVRFPRFSSDFRPAIGDGQVWDIEVSNPRMSAAQIIVQGVEQVPAEYDVRLLNTHNTVPVDIRLMHELRYSTVSANMQFRLIVGTKPFVEKEMSRFIPAEFALAQNYPNPFNPVTTITFMIPRASDVRLEILSVLGQCIKVLVAGHAEPALHSVLWDGTDQVGRHVSSGVYFCRLIADGSLIQIRKIAFIK